MNMTGTDVRDRLKKLNNTLVNHGTKDDNLAVGYAYSSGYMEQFMGDLLISFVPANIRHQLLEAIDIRIKKIEEENENS